MSTAYQRMAELLDRWQASVDLHARYLALDDEAYAKVQSWPKHQRPTRWVIDVARTRLAQMRRQLASHEGDADPSFAEALELMSQLTNLLGTEHIERYIPLATGNPAPAVSGTVRRPRLKSAANGRVAATPASRTPAAAGTSKPAPAAVPRPAAPPVSEKVVATVVADAVRFLSWGREWPALAPLIARLADRPPEPEVARILRAHRAAIEHKARHPA